MNKAFTKFLLASAVVISSLGLIEGDTAYAIQTQDTSGRTTLSQIDLMMERSVVADSKTKETSETAGNKTAVRFPNIFDIFRSLF